MLDLRGEPLAVAAPRRVEIDEDVVERGDRRVEVSLVELDDGAVPRELVGRRHRRHRDG